MTLKMKVAVWLGLAALTILLLWIFRGILLPFLVGLLLAYLLDPVTDWLERYRFSRGFATTLGWKVLDVDREEGDFLFDVQLSGPFVALTFSW